jgi:hypothetical protein
MEEGMGLKSQNEGNVRVCSNVTFRTCVIYPSILMILEVFLRGMVIFKVILNVG